MRYKKVLYILFIVLLLLPVIQKETNLIKIKELKGWIIRKEYSPFTVKGWLAGDYQNSLDDYLNDNVGFHEVFKRIRNQINYSLFGIANAAGVITGKDNYLYELDYIKAYNGENFIGTGEINEKVKKLSLINDSLKIKNISLLVCLAAGKASFYPAYFPEKYGNKKSDSTNIFIYDQYLNRYNIHTINFNNWFLEIKDTSKYLLYPKYGIHWSFYGETLVMDSIIRYIEKERNTDLPDMIIRKIKVSGNLKHSDYDIGEALNLIFRLPSQKMAYPDIRWTNDLTKTQPKVLVISDSFYWGMFSRGIYENCFSYGGFWYYFQKAYPGGTDVNTLNIKEEIENQDVIILMATEATLDRFAFGFIDSVYNLYRYPVVE